MTTLPTNDDEVNARLQEVPAVTVKQEDDQINSVLISVVVLVLLFFSYFSVTFCKKYG